MLGSDYPIRRPQFPEERNPEAPNVSFEPVSRFLYRALIGFVIDVSDERIASFYTFKRVGKDSAQLEACRPSTWREWQQIPPKRRQYRCYSVQTLQKMINQPSLTINYRGSNN
jgi:hypothetical protein